MIIIHAAGNEKIGVGNISRCNTLVTELKKSKEKIVVLYEATEEIFNEFLISSVETYRSNNRTLSKEIIEYMCNKYNAQIYICDLLDVDEQYHMYLKSIGFEKIVHMNDKCVDIFKPDILVDGDAFNKERVLPRNTMVLQGYKYHMVKQSIVSNRKSKSWDNDFVKNILICFGGSDPAYYSEFMAEKIYNDDCQYEFKIVLGPGVSKARKENIRKYKKNNLSFINNPKSMSQYILKSDLVITLGGLTTYEAMCLGIPVCSVEWEYMTYYTQNLEKIKLISNLGGIRDAYKNLTDICHNIKRLKEQSMNAWSKIDGLGCQRVSNYILQGSETIE